MWSCCFHTWKVGTNSVESLNAVTWGFSAQAESDNIAILMWVQSHSTFLLAISRNEKHVIPTKVFFPLPWLNTSATTARAPTQTSKPQMLLRNKKAQDRSEEEVQMLGLPRFFISWSKKATDKKRMMYPPCISWWFHPHNHSWQDSSWCDAHAGSKHQRVWSCVKESKAPTRAWESTPQDPELWFFSVLCCSDNPPCSSSSSCCYPIVKTKFQGVLVVQQKKTRIGTMRNNVVRASWVPLKIRSSLRTTQKKGSIEPVTSILTMTVHIWGFRVYLDCRNEMGHHVL